MHHRWCWQFLASTKLERFLEIYMKLMVRQRRGLAKSTSWVITTKFAIRSRIALFVFISVSWSMTNSNLKKKTIENLKEVSKKRQRNSFNLVKRKQVNEAIKVVCRWRLSKHPDLVGILPILLENPNPDHNSIGIGKIPILTSVLKFSKEFLWYS